ncbi:MAG: lysophospholipid acyltransferase family protein [Acidimicrobiia bacterium]|nr:lysophospholipid acyltransferase family protein [Acidimicrobiia bacterium]
MKHPVGWLARHLLDGDFSGREHLPSSGPYVVVANHLSLVDPVFVTLTVGELVQYLALDELFGQAKYLDEIFYYFGSIPLSRDRPPFGALQHALDLLEEGEIVGVFPEGARALHWGERSIKRGAAWLSLATVVPLVPVAITGTEATLSLAEPGIHIPSVRVSIHPPLYPGSYSDHEDPLQAMMDDWIAVLDDQLNHWTQKAEK